MDERELIPLKEARQILGVSHTTMARLVREGRFTIYQNPLDRRQKLVHIAEVRAAARPVPVARDQQHEEDVGDDQKQRSGPIPIRPPRLPEDDEFKASYELLRLLDRAQRAQPDAPFIQTQGGDILHPALHEGRISVPPVLFNRLLQETLLRVLAGVYHRRGPDVGREFVITQAGHDVLTRR